MTTASFTSWKLDLLNAAALDEKLKPVSVRMMVRLVEALSATTWDKDAGTCVARIGDDVFADEIPGLKDRQTLRDHRKALRDRGWLTFEPGSGRRATRYLLTDAPAKALLDHRDRLRDVRNERRAAEELERRAKTAEGGKRPLKSSPRGGQTSTSEGDVYPPVHLTGSPSFSALPVKDVAEDTREVGSVPPHDPATGEIHPCPECGKPAKLRLRNRDDARRLGGEFWCVAHLPLSQVGRAARIEDG